MRLLHHLSLSCDLIDRLVKGGWVVHMVAVSDDLSIVLTSERFPIMGNLGGGFRTPAEHLPLSEYQPCFVHLGIRTKD